MDLDRIRAYLQIACTGLGFDIGEVWWTTSNDQRGSPGNVEQYQLHHDQELMVHHPPLNGKLRFVQLYTSKSFESRRSDLVNPPDDSSSNDSEGGGVTIGISGTDNLNEHVLSPRLVEAVSQTVQVVWANTRKQEGLTGRSDIRLQTAVGIPVGVDAAGNMCIVVMFSPNIIPSNDEAMEYIQSLAKSATSSSIPCLLPVFNSSHQLYSPMLLSSTGPTSESCSAISSQLVVPHNALGDGVVTRFTSLGDAHCTGEHISPLDVSHAPKDTFGIPMLPSIAEMCSNNPRTNLPYEAVDVFDEASYGIWDTIMDDVFREQSISNCVPTGGEFSCDPNLQVILPDQRIITDARKERLEEFLSAFLGMSVFDMADVWIPAAADGFPDCLRHVTSVMSTSIRGNERLLEFRAISDHSLIKFWTGGVGRAYSSGNPVWTCNPQVFVDSGRAIAFERSEIRTVLAIPVFVAKELLPTCIVSCYSLVQGHLVPFVLKFVQQALRLLWDGLDQFEPQNSSIKNLYWNNVNPADLGEMAADVEMQHHFIQKKKRPHNFMTVGKSSQDCNTFISSTSDPNVSELQELQPQSLQEVALSNDSSPDQLVNPLQSIHLPNGDVVEMPLELPPHVDAMYQHQSSTSPVSVAAATGEMDDVQQRSTYSAPPMPSQMPSPVSDHISTNNSGSKRAHVTPNAHYPVPTREPRNITSFTFAPLPMPLPLPSKVIMRNQSAADTTEQHPKIQHRALKNVVASTLGVNETSSVPAQYHQAEIQKKPCTTSNLPQSMHLAPTPTPPQYAIGRQLTDEEVYCHAVGSDVGPFFPSCRIIGCHLPAMSRRPYCDKHSGSRICEHDGCPKFAQGCTRYCIAHGGGRRCTYPGCDKGARDKLFCAAHGGGKRCRVEGCSKSAVGGSDVCTSHGGGRRCEVAGCNKSAQSSTRFCVKHGGGKKCAYPDCDKVARGRTHYCAAHGGGVRCKLKGCNRVAIGRQQLCRAHGGSSTRARRTNRRNDDNDESLSPIPFNDNFDPHLPEMMCMNMSVSTTPQKSSMEYVTN